MKKFIDKEKNRIVTVLSVEEAKKILEMYIEFCLGKREVKAGRLNLVNYLGDFITYANEKDVVKFYDILVKEKDSFEFSKTDLKAYESLMAFFEIYNNIDKGEFELNNISNYINSALTRKQEIDTKVERNEELNFEEKLNSIFFNKDFDLSILAKKACDKWEEMLKQKIEQNAEGIEISLKEEIAYQDLLALSSKKEDNNVAKEIKKEVKEEKIETKSSAEEVRENEHEVKARSEENKSDKVEEPIAIEVEKPQIDNNEKEEVEKSGNEEEEIKGPQILNMVKNEKKEEKIDKPNSDKQEEEELIIGSSSIREATQDVSLRDAAGFFNNAIDNVSKKNNNDDNNDNNSDILDTTRGTLRDQ